MLPPRSPEELASKYFNQLAIGCDSTKCMQTLCKSNISFPYNFKDVDSTLIEALKLTIRHSTDPNLCYNVLSARSIAEIRSKVDEANVVLKKLIRGTLEPYLVNESVKILKDVISDHTVFPYLLLEPDQHILKSQLCLDESLINDIQNAISSNLAFFKKLTNQINLVIEKTVTYGTKGTVHHIRSIFLIFCFLSITKSRETLKMLFDHIANLNAVDTGFFWSMVRERPLLLEIILGNLVSYLEFNIMSSRSYVDALNSILHLRYIITNIKESSDRCARPIPPEKFYVNNISKWLDPTQESRAHKNHQLSFLSVPEILPLQVKIACFQASKRVPRLSIQLTQRNQLQLKANITTLLVRRERLILDTLKLVPRISDQELSNEIKIVFQNEQAIDQGGVKREFFYLLISQVFSPDYSMFQLIKNKFYWFNMHTLEHVSNYEVMGTIIALAMNNDIILPIRFPLLLYKKLLNLPILLADIAEIDEDAARSITSMNEMIQRGEDVSSIGITFSKTVDNFGQIVEVDLIPDGRNIEVTNDNFEEFRRAYVEWVGSVSVHSQYTNFERGFNKIRTQGMFNILCPEELDILISGQEVFDWDALVMNARYRDGYNSRSKQITWFWELFKKMTEDEKRKFLRFTTGTDRVPVGGLGEVIITISKSTDVRKLPVSHTCFNIFVLPAYKTKELLRKNVGIAIDHVEGFGIV